MRPDADGPASDPPPAIVGRGADLDVLRSFVREGALDGAALVLVGEPGSGKTTLLDAAAESASQDGAMVVRIGGTTHAAGVAYDALDQLLTSLPRHLTRVGPAHRKALQVVLGTADGPWPPPMLLVSATLEVLAELGRSRPSLVVIDDLQWVDHSSVEVIMAVARRLAGTRVALVGASDSPVPPVVTAADLRHHHLRPLEPQAAASLVLMRHHDIAPATMERILLEAQGNPLALVELPSSLTPQQLAGSARLPTHLPLTPHLAASLTAQLQDLPATTQDALLVASLEGSGDLEVVDRASQSLGGRDHLAPAEAAEIVAIDGHTQAITFRHPVVRAAVITQSTQLQRRRAHRALAAALVDQPERRVMHLANACGRVDEEIAALLEDGGRSYLRRGDARAAASAYVRAAQLSEKDRDRAGRLVEAAFVHAVFTGHRTEAVLLLRAARDADPVLARSLRARLVVAILQSHHGRRLDSVRRLLEQALPRSSTGPVDDEGTVDALHTFLTLSACSGRREPWEALDNLVPRVAAPPPLLTLGSRAFTDPGGCAAPLLSHVQEVARSLTPGTDLLTITRTGMAAIYLDGVGPLRQALWRVVRAGREHDALPWSTSALLPLCADDWVTGQWDEALHLARKGASHERPGPEPWPATSLLLSGFIEPLILAARGDADVTATLEKMEESAAGQGLALVTTLGHHVRTLASMAHGDLEAAYQHATAISPAGRMPPRHPHALWVLLDVVESAMRTGRIAEARAHVEAMRRHRIASISPRLALVVAGSAAIAEADARATPLFEQALALPEGHRWPFDRGRITLCFGEHLRRRHQVAEARRHLRAAAELFAGLGADPWSERTENQLRATGSVRSRARPRVAAVLNDQEVQIAQLAASGLSNKEIAARLHLSHRTIGATLYRMFPVLGISSRAGLRDALDAL